MGIENPKHFRKEIVTKECDRCNGTGEIKADFPGWSEVVIECPSCHGIGHLNIISVNKREDIEDNYLG